jgi:hypothetical protein
MRDSRAGRRRNGFALVLLLAALLVRGAIPQGYMAQSSEPGVLTVTICHSDAVWQVPLAKTNGRLSLNLSQAFRLDSPVRAVPGTGGRGRHCCRR